MRPLLASLLTCVLAGLLLAACRVAESHEPAAWEAPAIQAVTLDARRPPSDSLLVHLAGLGVTHLTLIPFGFMPTPFTPELRMNPDARWYSESDVGIRTLAAKADTLGMAVILKPHIWIGRYSVGEVTRAGIDFETEAAWQTWEAQYRDFLLHYAHLGATIGAPLLVLGTELANPARERPQFWRGLIDTVRTVYGGELTYAANWYDEYEHIPFWDALDYVGVQAYFPLADTEAPPAAAELAAAWQAHGEALAAIARRTGQPVLFTEIGYRSVPYAAREPWRWASRDEAAAGLADPDLQARLYDAFFAGPWRAPWMAGAIVWKWQSDGDRRRADRHRIDFTPQGKPAEAVIRRAFSE